MKTLTVVVLLALTSLPGHAQNTNMAVATYGIKGPIRTFRIEVATFVPKDGSSVEGPRVLRSEASFNEDGNRTDLRFYNDQGALTGRIAMTYNGRKMIESINSDGGGRDAAADSILSRRPGPVQWIDVLQPRRIVEFKIGY